MAFILDVENENITNIKVVGVGGGGGNAVNRMVTERPARRGVHQHEYGPAGPVRLEGDAEGSAWRQTYQGARCRRKP